MRNPEKFEAFDLYAQICSLKKYSMNDKGSIDKFLVDINNSLSNVSDIQLYGKVTELAFFHMVKALKTVKFIKQEDIGECYCIQDIQIPDYKIVLPNNETILVEVKNNNSNINKDFSISAKYYQNLSKYGQLLKTDIYIAIYWRKFNLWTLNKLSAFKKINKSYKISFSYAMMHNYMHILGDLNIGTKPKLSIRLYPTEECYINDNVFDFIIGDTKIFCNDVEVTKKIEKNLVLLFMFFSKWKSDSTVIQSQFDKKIEYLEFFSIPDEPEEEVNNQGFAMLGFLSSIYTNYYRYIIAPNGEIENIYISKNLCVEIPNDYKGDSLPLWRFTVISCDEKIKEDQ